jgi:hypothetical protein
VSSYQRESIVDRTNAERQRRYRANRKAAAADNTVLRQQITALQQKVTMLEQALAQQGATPKPRQQAADVPSGLGMEAQQAASTKASPGVVGIGLDALEAAKTKPPPLQIQPWVPEEERQAIKETWESPFFDFDEHTRARVRRLVEDERMEDLWKNLPEGAFSLAIYALGIFPLLRPPPQSKRGEPLRRWEQRLQRWEEHFFKYWVKHPHPTMGYDLRTLAGWACDLRDALVRWRDMLGPRSNEILSAHLRRGPVFKDARLQPFLDKADYTSAKNTVDVAIGWLDALYHCFLSIDEQHRSEVRRLPKIAHPDDREAPRRFFMDFMSDRYCCNAVVADLTAIAFDRDIGPETVQRRRRLRAA